MEHEEQIAELLKHLGMPASLCGYDYLKYGIEIGLHVRLHGAITRIVYPMIAKQYNTEPSRVERCIRNAIEVLWERGNLKELERMFGYSVDPLKGRPTNMEFISTICEYMQIRHIA